VDTQGNIRELREGERAQLGLGEREITQEERDELVKLAAEERNAALDEMRETRQQRRARERAGS